MILLNLEIIEKSPTIEIDGETIVDLTSQILNDNIKLSFDENDKQYQIGSEMLVKPSLLAKFVFGSTSKLDYLAYYNGFSNPFAIPVGYILRIPELVKINSSLSSNGSSNNNNISRDLFNKKKSVVDEKRKRMISNDLERPNMNTSLVQNTVLSDRIILGTNSVNQNTSNSLSFIKEEGEDQIIGLVDHFEEFLKNG
jgi:hypothetical protein